MWAFCTGPLQINLELKVACLSKHTSNNSRSICNNNTTILMKIPLYLCFRAFDRSRFLRPIGGKQFYFYKWLEKGKHDG